MPEISDIEKKKLLDELFPKVPRSSPLSQPDRVALIALIQKLDQFKIINDLHKHGFYQDTDTPLTRAAKMGDLEICALLLENGAQVDAKEFLGQTALMHAAAKGHTQIVELLLDKGADINLAPINDWVPLLVESTQGFNTGTPLSWALSEKKNNNVILLLSRGAEIPNKQLAACKPFMLKSAELCFSKKSEKGNRDGIAALKRCINLYPHDKQLVQAARLSLVRHYLSIDPMSKETMLAVLALDSSNPDANETHFKEQVLRAYFLHSKPNDDVNLIIPILKHSHLNPELVWETINEPIVQQSELPSLGEDMNTFNQMIEKKPEAMLYIADPIANPTAPPAVIKLGFWPTIKKWFQTRSNIENLETELTKDIEKQNPKKIQSILRNICAENKKLPPKIFEHHPDIVISFLNTIINETSKDMKVWRHLGDSSLTAYEQRSAHPESLRTDEIHYIFDEKNKKTYSFYKDEAGMIHKNIFDAENISQAQAQIHKTNWPLKKAINNQIENYYFNLANNYFTQCKAPNKSKAEKNELLDKALEACLKLPSRTQKDEDDLKADFNADFKTMIVEAYLSNMEGNNMASLSEPVLTSIKASHNHPELTYAILQTEKQRQDHLSSVAKTAPTPPELPATGETKESLPISEDLKKEKKPAPKLG